MYNFGVVMTDEEKKLLSTFEARLRHLIYLHDELKRENAELKQLLEAKEEEYGKRGESTCRLQRAGKQLHEPKNSYDNQP